jgi:hypothetical protein
MSQTINALSRRYVAALSIAVRSDVTTFAVWEVC